MNELFGQPNIILDLNLIYYVYCLSPWLEYISKLSPAFTACTNFDDGHSDLYEVTPHCNFDVHFSHDERCSASFHVFNRIMNHGALLFDTKMMTFLVLRIAFLDSAECTERCLQLK